MSNEHDGGTAQPEAGGGSTGPQSQEGQPSEAHEAVAPAVSDTERADAPPVVESQPTLALKKVTEPAPTTEPEPVAAAVSEPTATLEPAPAAAYIDAPPPAPQSANPYAPPSAHTSPAEPHHPFGAGQPLGGWGTTPPGGTSYPPYPSDLGGYGSSPAAPKKRGGLMALVAAVALVAGLAGGAMGFSLADRNGGGSSPVARTSTTTTVSDNQSAMNRAPDSVAGIAAKAVPSTVTIKAQGSQESGTGTGFVFDTEGHILTNNHVVAPAVNGGKLTVKFSDGSAYNASVVGRAQGYDVAVIKLDNPPTNKLVPLPLGDSDKVAVGDTTVAIGAPYGLEGTVTSGIVSAKNRPVASGDQTGAQQSYMNALQTDASINPGNSGGPLLNASGQVIGINSAIQSNSGGSSGGGQAGSIGLGFAIPINQAKWVAQTLISDGTPVYAILGVLRDDNYNGDGAKIRTDSVSGTPAVTPHGPADDAGLKPGDVITKLGGIAIDSGPTLVSEIWTHKPGEKVDVEYTRDGKAMKTTVTLGSRKGDN